MVISRLLYPEFDYFKSKAITGKNNHKKGYNIK